MEEIYNTQKQKFSVLPKLKDHVKSTRELFPQWVVISLENVSILSKIRETQFDDSLIL